MAESGAEGDSGAAEKDPRQRSEMIIHAAAAAAAGVAAACVIPGSDAVAIMPIQVAMVAAVAREHGVEPSSSLVKSTIYASLGSIVGKGGARLLARYTPFSGNVVRGGVAFSVTECLGRIALDRLEAGEGLV
jgi:uncharacterized protein (DUF697 family)